MGCWMTRNPTAAWFGRIPEFSNVEAPPFLSDANTNIHLDDVGDQQTGDAVMQ